jgi:hypothetical protein
MDYQNHQLCLEINAKIQSSDTPTCIELLWMDMNRILSVLNMHANMHFSKWYVLTSVL